MPPLGQYFARLEKNEFIAAPKGHGPRTLSAFPLQNDDSWGQQEGTTIAVSDPGKPTP